MTIEGKTGIARLTEINVVENWRSKVYSPEVFFRDILDNADNEGGYKIQNNSLLDGEIKSLTYKTERGVTPLGIERTFDNFVVFEMSFPDFVRLGYQSALKINLTYEPVEESNGRK